MKQRSPDECIARILRDIDKRRNISPMDYADRNAVRRYNAAMDRILENACYLWNHYPDQRDLFIDLVRSSDCFVASHCAHILYGIPDATVEHKRLALTIVKELIENPNLPELSRVGMSMNIKRWEEELE